MYNFTFVDVSQFVKEPIRTGVQRVLVKFLENCPRNSVMPFRVLGDQVAILDPTIFDAFVRFFNKRTPSDRALVAQYQGMSSDCSEEENLVRLIGQAPLALLQARRFFYRAARILNLEAFSDPVRSRFYISCPPAYRYKVTHFIHDFLLYEEPHVFPQLNWRYAHDNVLLFEAYCAAGTYLVSTQAMRNKVARYFNRPLSDSVVVHFGGEVASVPLTQSGVPIPEQPKHRRRVLMVGTIEPRKYPLEVASALDELAVRHPDLDCVIVGTMGWLSPETHAAVEAILAGNRVKHLPRLGDLALAELTSTSDVAIYVSTSEGFGLPVIEYAAQGIPLVTNHAVPASELIEDPRATILESVTISALIEAVEHQLMTAHDRTPYYPWTWSNFTSEIIALHKSSACAADSNFDGSFGWSVAVRLVRELRAKRLGWEELKREVRAHLSPSSGASSRIQGNIAVAPDLITDTVEQVSEIVSDNIHLVHWADRLAVQPLLQDLIRCVTAKSHLEGIGRAFRVFLGRPVDARAGSEVVGYEDDARRLRRIVELIHCDEASDFLPEVTAVAIRSIVGDVNPLLECLVSTRQDLSRLFGLLGIDPPTIEDVFDAEKMRANGLPTPDVVLYFSHRRRSRGDSLDLVLEAMAKVSRGQAATSSPKGIPSEPMVSAQPSNLDIPVPVLPDAVGENAASQPGTQDAPGLVSRRVPLHSSLFSEGWYDVEVGESLYRWMGKRSSVVNPEPLRSLDHVRLAVSMVYGADKPFLTASIDEVNADTTIERAPDGNTWIIRVMANSPSAHHAVLSIYASITDSPARAEGVDDSRELSFAVTDCVFVYSSIEFAQTSGADAIDPGH